MIQTGGRSWRSPSTVASRGLWVTSNFPSKTPKSLSDLVFVLSWRCFEAIHAAPQSQCLVAQARRAMVNAMLIESAACPVYPCLTSLNKPLTGRLRSQRFALACAKPLGNAAGGKRGYPQSYPSPGSTRVAGRTVNSLVTKSNKFAVSPKS